MADDPKLYVEHILAEIEVLESIAQHYDFQEFQADPIVYRGAVYSVQCISEASKSLPSVWLEEFPHIRWRDIRDIGSHTRHEYSRLKPFLIWDIMMDHLPSLKSVMITLKAK